MEAEKEFPASLSHQHSGISVLGTDRFQWLRSVHLIFWRPRQDSNPRPPRSPEVAHERDALAFASRLLRFRFPAIAEAGIRRIRCLTRHLRLAADAHCLLQIVGARDQLRLVEVSGVHQHARRLACRCDADR
jgi:hypothetical protein